MSSADITKITIRSRHYPALLKEISAPPPALYLRGHAEVLNNNLLLAVVGSRKAGNYAQWSIDTILPPAIAAGVKIVSGMAYGVDSLAHQACLKENQPTIAVLGCGIDDASIYPRTNLKLAHKIIAGGGALISEYAPGTPPMKHHFPARNRIIAGLARATLLVQAAAKSGSLITARLALDFNRDVCVIPGNINDPLCAGTNELLKFGAIPITNPDDIFHLFDLAPADIKRAAAKDFAPKFKPVLKHLSRTPRHIDFISAQSNIPAENLAPLLLEMELNNAVQNVGGMKYVKK